MYRASIPATHESFDILPDETVLDAALRQGIALEYGCRHGNCSSCKYLLENGDVDHGDASIYSLTETERDDGYALLCCAKPVSDLVIEARGGLDARALAFIKPAEYLGSVTEVRRLTSSLWQLSISTPQALPFHAGQFVELKLDGEDFWRSYSVASAPANGKMLSFIIKHIEGGRFSTRLAALSPNSPIALRGPFGTSYLRHGDAPVLLVAIGSGISPILSILQHAAAVNDPRRFEFYYGARTALDLPVQDELASLQAKMKERFVFRPVLSCAGDDWNGLRGRVTQALQRELPDARPYDAYLCGAPDMCDAVATLLEAKGIRAGQLFFDKFHPAT